MKERNNRGFMMDLNVIQTARLDSALKRAVIESWHELMPDSPSGLIHIEYQTGDDGSLEFLKIWASTTWGYWNLVCEMWMRALWSNALGLRFANDYHSATFAKALDLAMGQGRSDLNLANQHGLIQVDACSSNERTEVNPSATVPVAA
jgi:hypothetical protein